MKATRRKLLMARVLAGWVPLAYGAEKGSSIGFAVGQADARSVGATLAFTGDFRFPVGSIFSLSPGFSYWKKTESSLEVTASVQDLYFGADIIAAVPLGRRVRVYA